MFLYRSEWVGCWCAVFSWGSAFFPVPVSVFTAGATCHQKVRTFRHVIEAERILCSTFSFESSDGRPFRGVLRLVDELCAESDHGVP